MKIAMIGCGYVGLVSAACFSDAGNQVCCVDNDQQKIDSLSKGEIPIFEPGLYDLVSRGLRTKSLEFSTNLKKGVEQADICFITVGTPSQEDGQVDLKYVFEVAKLIGKHLNGYKIIVTKSTVPVGTSEKVKQIIIEEVKKRKKVFDFDIVSNPEFLKEGVAVRDFLSPDRVVLGVESDKAEKIMRRIYDPFFRLDKRIIVMDVRSAEMSKYASNCMLACRISFMNEMANICEKVGADVDLMRKAIGSDQRIGKKFLFPGIGYGGSCFPKDIRGLIKLSHDLSYRPSLLESIEDVNEAQKSILANKVIDYFNQSKGGIKNKKVAIWGLAFKPNTDDMREAPSITIINILLEYGANIIAFDPEAKEMAYQIFGDKIQLVDSKEEALSGADILLVLTEWSMFRGADFEEVKKLMKKPIIFDGRNVYDPKHMASMGFKYFSIGRKMTLK